MSRDIPIGGLEPLPKDLVEKEGYVDLSKEHPEKKFRKELLQRILDAKRLAKEKEDGLWCEPCFRKSVQIAREANASQARLGLKPNFSWPEAKQFVGKDLFVPDPHVSGGKKEWKDYKLGIHKTIEHWVCKESVNNHHQLWHRFSITRLGKPLKEEATAYHSAEEPVK